MAVLTGVMLCCDLVPMHASITIFSLAIIVASSNRSLYELIDQFKKA